MRTVRYLDRFENVTGTISYVFPLAEYQWSENQQYRASMGTVVGADYAWDYNRFGRAPKGVAFESITCSIIENAVLDIDTELDLMKRKLREVGLGKLWTVDSSGVRRWAYARSVSAPAVSVQGTGVPLSVVLSFMRLGDWQSQAQTTGTIAITATPTTFNIRNAGNTLVHDIVFRYRANASSGYDSPQFVNNTNGYLFTIQEAAGSADDEIKIDTKDFSILKSTDDGVTYPTNVYSSLVLASTQVSIMKLNPGANAISVTGTAPNFSLEYSFYAAWE